MTSIDALMDIWRRQQESGAITPEQFVHKLETLSRYVELELRHQQAALYVAMPAPDAYLGEWNRES